MNKFPCIYFIWLPHCSGRNSFLKSQTRGHHKLNFIGMSFDDGKLKTGTMKDNPFYGDKGEISTGDNLKKPTKIMN